MLEGLTNADEDTNSDDSSASKKKKADSTANATNATPNIESIKKNLVSQFESKLNNNKQQNSIPDLTDINASTSEDNTVPDESAMQESMTSLNPAPNNRIDYASTVEDAYDDLNKIIGGDGIKRLTNDTQKLMQQQVALADAMKNMTPLMSQAKELLQGFDLKNLDGLASMAKQFTNKL